MVWIEFMVSSALLTLAAYQLARAGDIIALRTRLGGLFVGTILLASATSLPEVLTTVSSIAQGMPDLAAGNLLGSNMFLLAVLDVVHYKHRLLRKAALKHTLSGSLAVFLISLVVLFIVADLDLQVGWVGLDSLMLILAYLGATWLMQNQVQSQALSVSTSEQGTIDPRLPTLRTAVLIFLLASGALLVLTPWMVNAAGRIATLTGLGTTFIGSTLVAMVTSLPEMVTTFAAARLGADDMAIGNLFGSNMFNMAALGVTDFFFLEGRFLGSIDDSFLLVAMLGLVMTVMGLVGNIARLQRRIFILEIDALGLILLYLGGMWLLYLRGAG